MTTRTAVIVGLLLTAAALVYALVLYPALPDQIPTHWGIDGRVDGWGDKQWAAFVGPVAMGVLLGLLFLLPWLSPQSFSVEAFRSTFNYLMVVLIGLMGFLHFISLQAALRPDLDLARVLMSGLFLCFALIGNVLGKVRRNFWMGVRTPWTLASERVWIATHRLAAGGAADGRRRASAVGDGLAGCAAGALFLATDGGAPGARDPFTAVVQAAGARGAGVMLRLPQPAVTESVKVV
jgi:uncharacterized membrane protein